METFSALLALCEGNHKLLMDSHHKGQWRGALMFSLVYARTNGWANSPNAGYLRRHEGHYKDTAIWRKCIEVYIISKPGILIKAMVKTNTIVTR